VSETPARSSAPDIGSMVVALIAVVGLVFGTVALASNDDGSSEGTAAGSGASVASLTEFAIAPGTLRVATGSELEVVNEGSVVHNLSVAGTETTTPDLQAGENGMLDTSALEIGSYRVICTIPGHESAGMEAVLEVSDGGAVSGSALEGAGEGSEQDWAALDAAMTESMLQFPAETEGTGNTPLEFETDADGTKVFDITAEITPWEVEPGKFVDAWTYNGQVPGPWIDVDLGDKVRVNVHNELPMGTDVHWHGVHTPNDQDGVAPYTQDLIEAGEDFTYEFVAEDAATGMYHAHHHGQMQVVNGMFGAFTIGDLPLPTGRTISGTAIPENVEISQEIPMVLNDAGVIGFSLNGKSFPATAPVAAKQGDYVMIHYYNEGLGSHPMHLHQFPQLVVAKDGIPLDEPYYADTINVAPGERYSVLVQLEDPGTWVWHCHILTHVERETGMFGMVTAFVVE